MPNIAHTPPILTPNPRRDRLASWRIGGLILLLLVFCQGAWAADVGCAVDSDRNGTVDNWCAAPDGDADGWATVGYSGPAGVGTDCDDANPMDYPGVVTACDPAGDETEGYHTCQTDGTYTTCIANATTPLCEATTGNCYYIACGTGSDSTGDGSYANPWESFGMVTGGYGAVPAGKVTLNDDDHVYFLGTGDCTTTYLRDGRVSLAFFWGETGTALKPIVIKRYPGATTKFLIDPTTWQNVVDLQNGTEYIYFEDLEFTATTKATASPSVFRPTSHALHTHFTRMWFHDIGFDGDSNSQSILADSTNGTQIDHSLFQDIENASGNVTNHTAAVMWLDDDTAGEGADHSATFNTASATAWSDTLQKAMFKQKHGTKLADTGANGHIIKWNIGVNVGGIITNGSGLRAAHNLFIATGLSSAITYGLAILPESTIPHEDNRFQYNTVACSGTAANQCDIVWTPAEYSSTNDATFDHNIKTSAGSTDGDRGFMVWASYGTADNLASWESGVFLASDYNCFYNATAVNSCYFCGSGAGSKYTFANWQDIKGFDTHSYSEDPALDADYMPAAAHCSDKGWRTASDYPAVPTVGLSGFSAASNIFSFTGGN